ncbi:hypothetical protein SAMN00120144_4090 [Hymenobacter roseosalivarius DSM 11622]|uniref:Uncharacterized protein n=1 Tax=Hymenobacter roseosalivarius DSM 11622 TaxID=645990 RepID=A0A1W1W4U3_9BACT|nr:hypothetical protein SAMN00120144_4090 [Hymenobacter roseosalivarius DSM 11622]
MIDLMQNKVLQHLLILTLVNWLLIYSLLNQTQFDG